MDGTAPLSSGPPPTRASSRSLTALHSLDAANPDLATWLNQHLHASSGAELSSSSASVSISNASPASSSLTASSRLTAASEALRSVALELGDARERARSEIQHLITSLVGTIPKLGLELSITNEAARALQAQLDAAEAAVTRQPIDAATARAEPATATTLVDQALARISTLSLLNQSLVSTRNTLREAQAWSTLEAEVGAFLSDQRWKEASDRIAKARDSLAVFQGGSSGNSIQERTALLHRLTERVQTELVPILERAIKARDIETVVRMAELLIRLGRNEAGFCETYFATRRADPLRNWAQRNADAVAATSASASASPSSSSSSPAALSVLGMLFADVLGVLGEERMYADKIFADQRQAVELLLASILAELQPSLLEYLHRFEALPTVEDQLAMLVKAFQSAEGAYRSLADMIPSQKTAVDIRDDDERDGALSPPVRSLHVSKVPLLSSVQLSWRDALFEPFLEWQTRFVALETQAISNRLRTKLDASSSASGDLSRDLRSRLTITIDAIGDSLRRSRAFTRGYATGPLLSPLENLLSSIFDQQRESVASLGRSVVSRIEDRARQHLNSGSLSYDDREQGLTNEDWEDFQRGIELLAACRDAMAQVLKLELSVAGQLVDVGANLPAKTAEELATVRTVQDEGSAFTPFTPLSRSSLNSPLLRHWVDLSSRLLSSSSYHVPSSTPTPHRDALLSRTHGSLLTLARTTQRYLHDLLLAPFTVTLAGYVQLPLWTASRHPSAVNEYDLAMPQFSLSATDPISRIGEGLLNLPRLIEVYAEEAWLAFPRAHADDPPASALPPSFTPPTPTAQEDPRRSLQHRQAFSTSAVPAAPLASHHASSETTLTAFLASLLATFLDRFLHGSVAALPPLSEVGVAQLGTDLDYLVNICAALNDAEGERRCRIWRGSCLEQVGKGEAEAEREDGGGEEGARARRVVGSLRQRI